MISGQSSRRHKTEWGGGSTHWPHGCNVECYWLWQRLHRHFLKNKPSRKVIFFLPDMHIHTWTPEWLSASSSSTHAHTNCIRTRILTLNPPVEENRPHLAKWLGWHFSSALSQTAHPTQGVWVCQSRLEAGKGSLMPFVKAALVNSKNHLVCQQIKKYSKIQD